MHSDCSGAAFVDRSRPVMVPMPMPMPRPMSLQARALALGRQLLDDLRPLVRDADGAIILDFPNHNNFGDALLSQGLLTVLGDLGLPVRVIRERDRDLKVQLERTSPHAVVIFNGGGNFGDLYPHLHQRRLDVVALLGARRCVLAPQTMCFATRSPEATRRQLEQHPSLTLLWRDQVSAEAARDWFPSHASYLVPDLAFGLASRLHGARRGSHDGPLVLARGDQESSGLSGCREDLAGFPFHDWEHSRLSWWESRRLARFIAFAELHPLTLEAAERSACRRIARLQTRRAIRQVVDRQVVLTDRLHGWILSCILGVPVVAVDTPHHKIRDLTTTWFGELPTVVPSTAVHRAIALARSLSGSPSGHS